MSPSDERRPRDARGHHNRSTRKRESALSNAELGTAAAPARICASDHSSRGQYALQQWSPTYRGGHLAMRLLVSLGLLLSAPLVAQGAYVNYGHGCNSYGTPPLIGIHSGVPRVGTTVLIGGTGGTLNLGARYTVSETLATGASRTSYLGSTLPIRIPPHLINYGGLDCDIWCSVEWIQSSGVWICY